MIINFLNTRFLLFMQLIDKSFQTKKEPKKKPALIIYQTIKNP